MIFGVGDIVAIGIGWAVANWLVANVPGLSAFTGLWSDIADAAVIAPLAFGTALAVAAASAYRYVATAGANATPQDAAEEAWEPFHTLINVFYPNFPG